MDSDILSTINGENSVDGVQNWNEASDDESLDFDQSQSTEKNTIHKFEHLMDKSIQSAQNAKILL